jgi:hypothetical protein
MKTTVRISTVAALATIGLALLTSGAFAAPPDPPGGGLRLYVQKRTYRVGEPIKFMLYKHGNTVDDMPANLTRSYYIIEKRTPNNRGREFYTSEREPVGTSLNLDTRRVFGWDQLDNERTHRARPGQWRLKFYTPRISPKPLVVHFRIVG